MHPIRPRAQCPGPAKSNVVTAHLRNENQEGSNYTKSELVDFCERVVTIDLGKLQIFSPETMIVTW